MIVQLDGLTIDVPATDIAFAVAPLFTAMASLYGTPGTIRILDACKEVR